MPVYNGEKFLEETIQSVLRQTYQDFRFLIIDDASSDGSWDILTSIDDARVDCIQNDENLGLAKTLNRGLELCDTEYVVRMDADDLCSPRRIAMQVSYMDSHPDLGMSGTWLRTFGIRRESNVIRYAESMPQIRANMLFGSPVAHATLIFRLKAMNAADLRYNPAFTRSEDFDLCVRAADRFPIGNLQRCTYYYRRHPGCITKTKEHDMLSQVRSLVRRQVEALDLRPSDHTLDLHCSVTLGERVASLDGLDEVHNWFMQLLLAAERSKRYDTCCVAKTIAKFWFHTCVNASPLGWKSYRRCFASSLLHADMPSVVDRLLFALRILWHRRGSHS